MKIIYTFLLLFAFSFNINSQLAYKSIAPDFTATDINGEEHNLYELLDDGKVVVLDVFATWCGPCWSFHSQHILEDMFKDNGPAGTNDIYVFAIEGDGNTNLPCIYDEPGCNSSTWGDWTDGVSYPIIDSRAIAEDYAISYFPTLYVVYPNKQVVEIRDRSRNGIQNLINQAPSPEAGTNPVVLYSRSENGSVCPKQFPSRPHFLLSNMGTETITSMDLEVTENGDVIYQSSWNGEAKTYQIIEDLTLPASIAEDNKVYELTMKNINGDNSASRSHTLNLTLKVDNIIQVNITTDENAAQDNNRYEIVNKNGDVVVSESINEPNTNYTKTHFVGQTGCHKFIIYDEGGNGIEGEILVTDSEGNVIYTTKTFEQRDVQEFRTTLVNSISDNELDEIIIAPNPASDYLRIENGNDAMNIQILDASGRLMSSFANWTEKTIDIRSLPGGMYFVNVTSNGVSLTKKIVKL